MPREDGEKVAAEAGMKYYETSAKTGKNVSEMFFQLAETIISKQGGISAKNSGDTQHRLVNFGEEHGKKKKKGGCTIL